MARRRAPRRKGSRPVADPDNYVAVSATSDWEIGIKRALGKLDAPEELAEVIASSGFEPLPIKFPHAIVAGRLAPHHRDPFDRMLVAQAMVEQLIVVTRDRSFANYDVPTLVC